MKILHSIFVVANKQNTTFEISSKSFEKKIQQKKYLISVCQVIKSFFRNRPLQKKEGWSY